MKKYIYLTSIITVLLLFSCSQMEDLDSRKESKDNLNFKLPENDAIKLVDAFNPKSRAIHSPSIKKAYYLKTSSKAQTRNSSSEDIIVYQVDLNNEEKGFALVSGDTRMPCVIAYSEKGEINDTLTNKGAAMMIKNAESVFLQSIENAKGTVLYPEGTLLQRVGPLVNVAWGQESPYNDLMPASSTFTDYYYNSKFPTGCVAVSMAQIMSYFRPTMAISGTVIDWSGLTAQSYISPYSSSPLKNQVALLMHYITDGTKTVFIESLGASTSINNTITFLNKNGVSINNAQAMSVSEVTTSLKMLQPVLVTGSTGPNSSHCWIVDGFQILKNANNNMNTYVHANFGWSGNENGYYLASTNNFSFDTEYNGNYNTNLKIYSRIRR